MPPRLAAHTLPAQVHAAIFLAVVKEPDLGFLAREGFASVDVLASGLPPQELVFFRADGTPARRMAAMAPKLSRDVAAVLARLPQVTLVVPTSSPPAGIERFVPVHLHAVAAHVAMDLALVVQHVKSFHSGILVPTCLLQTCAHVKTSAGLANLFENVIGHFIAVGRHLRYVSNQLGTCGHQGRPHLLGAVSLHRADGGICTTQHGLHILKIVFIQALHRQAIQSAVAIARIAHFLPQDGDVFGCDLIGIG
mmetsp:Transcript_107261/g.298799  ORF Transcript_107261/g.298799 Transcript_107261/m.298799 type:complete len:251 (+) Transcript_107261:863-1615(+)